MTTYLKFYFFILMITMMTSGNAQHFDAKEEYERGSQFFVEKKLDSALLAFEQSAELELKDKNITQYLRAKSQALRTRTEMGKYLESGQMGEALIEEYEDFLKSKPAAAALIYSQIGAAYSLGQADNFKGMRFLQHALHLVTESGVTDPKLLSDIYHKLSGSKYYNLEYDSAIYFGKQSIEVYAKSHNYYSPFVGENYRGIANGFWGLGQLDSAAFYIDKALNVYEHSEKHYGDDVARVLHSRGYLFLEEDKNEEAYRTFRKAAKLYESHLPSIHPRMIWIYGDVGRALFRMQAYDSALYYYQKGLVADTYNFDDMDIYVNPELEDINDEFQFFMVLKLKAQALAERFLLEKDSLDRNAMWDAYLKTDAMIDKFRKGVTNITDHDFLNFTATEICAQAFQFFIKIYEIEKDEIWLERAHYFSEKHNLSVVHSNFVAAQAKGSGLVKSEFLEKEAAITKKITTYKSELLKQLEAQNLDSISQVRKRLFLAERDLENFIKTLNQEYPSFHKSKYDFDVVGIKEVQQTLAKKHPGSAFINFFERQNVLNVSVITKDYVDLFVVKSEGFISDEILEYRSSLIAGNDQEYQSMATRLYDLLMARPLAFLNEKKLSIDQLIIVPTRSLQLLPFETLKASEAEGDSYLFEQYDINYHYSATLLVKNAQLHSSNGNSFVGMAPNFKDSLAVADQNYKALPGSEKEVNILVELLGGRSFTGIQASEEVFKAEVNQAGLIHLATHAKVDEVYPENSYLAFSHSSAADEDGKLHFFEIYALNFNAQLVTLSSCNTGFGQIKKGEGVMSLSRAFAYAGVPSTVVSLWPASDKSTPELMKYFYQNLKDGQRKSVALNNARKQYLATATGKARHPFYWGGFVVIGDDSPITTENSYVAMILSLLFLLTAVPIVLVIKNKYLSID